MNTGAMKQRRDEVITRMLDITATLKEMKRAWIVTGQDTDFEIKAALESEYANLACERNKLCLAIHADKKAEQVYTRATFTATLVRLLHTRGLTELVREAERISMDEIRSNNLGIQGGDEA